MSDRIVCLADRRAEAVKRQAARSAGKKLNDWISAAIRRAVQSPEPKS